MSSNSDVDVHMFSPPSSPTPSSTHHALTNSLIQKRSNPLPIMAKSPTPSSRFQPPIHKSSSPAFTPATAYHQSIFKPKTPRSASYPVKTHSPAINNHTNRAFQPSPTALSLSPPPTQPHNINPSDSDEPDSSSRPPLVHFRTKSPMMINRTAPLQIPQHNGFKPSSSPPHRHPPPPGRSLGASNYQSSPLTSQNNMPLPQSLPNLSPSFPATLFGGLSANDEHVTVWEPVSGKTVAGNAAPYRRNLAAWLEGHSGWEEKADELKSSKRRSAARRSRAAADAFSVLCCFPVATILANEAAKYLQALGDGDHCNEEAMMMWTSDDFVRLQEALFRLGQEMHAQHVKMGEVDDGKWGQVSAQIGGSKMQGAVVYCAHHMLTRGIAKSQKEMGSNAAMANSFGAVTIGNRRSSNTDVSPGSLGSHDTDGKNFFDIGGPSSLPTIQLGGLGASFLERSFRAPREPRVTVWNPNNGRTISGNAAPCRRNLEAWMRQHPGWLPKEEGQLSSSRRNRNRNGKVRPSSLPTAEPEIVPLSVEPESPHFQEAVQGLLCLSGSPSVGISPGNPLTADAQLEEQVARVEAEFANSRPLSRMESVEVANGGDRKKLGMTSSISSSSDEDGDEISDREDMEL